MSNQYFNLMLARVRTELPGASDAGIKQVLWSVFNQFFDLSSAWIENIPFTTVTNQLNYSLAPAEDPPGRIIRLAGVVDQGKIMQPAVMDPPGTVLLRNAPNGATVFTAMCIKTVTLDEDQPDFVPEVPARFFEQWLDAFVYGVLANMMAQSGKSYSNPVLSVDKRLLFERECANARVATIRRNTYGANSWVYPQNFRTRGQRGGVSVGNTGTF